MVHIGLTSAAKRAYKPEENVTKSVAVERPAPAPRKAAGKVTYGTLICPDCGAKVMKTAPTQLRCKGCACLEAKKKRVAYNKKLRNKQKNKNKEAVTRPKTIGEIGAEARALGLTYGQYVVQLKNAPQQGE